jgi:hypothetical protein
MPEQTIVRNFCVRTTCETNTDFVHLPSGQQNYEMGGASVRLNSLLEKAWEKSDTATILLSTLLPSNNDNGANDRVDEFNPQIRNCTCSWRLLSAKSCRNDADAT